jgi:hypothetical protein
MAARAAISPIWQFGLQIALALVLGTCAAWAHWGSLEKTRCESGLSVGTDGRLRARAARYSVRATCHEKLRGGDDPVAGPLHGLHAQEPITAEQLLVGVCLDGAVAQHQGASKGGQQMVRQALSIVTALGVPFWGRELCCMVSWAFHGRKDPELHSDSILWRPFFPLFFFRLEIVTLFLNLDSQDYLPLERINTHADP